MHWGGNFLPRETPATYTLTGVRIRNHHGVDDGIPLSNARDGAGNILEPSDSKSERAPSASI